MEETLKMMREIIIGKEKDTNEIELIKLYKQTLKPNILAFLFVKYYGIIYNTSLEYKILTDEDKASFCIQELDKALFTYNINYNAKFITYFIKCYKNRLRTETESELYKKRKAIHFSDNIDDCNTLSITNDYDDIINYKQVLNNLNIKQKKFCELAYSGYSIHEIAKILNISFSYVLVLKNQAKQKLFENLV